MRSGIFRGKCSEFETLEPSVLPWDVFIKPLPSEIREPLGEEARRLHETVRTENSRETDRTGFTHIRTQRDHGSKHRACTNPD